MDPDQAAKRAEDALLELALESWRFQKLFGRALSKLDPLEATRFTNQHRYFLGKVESCLGASGMRLVNLEGQQFDTGTAATPLNIADFGPDDTLVVAETIDPIVMNSAGLLRMGTVMLKKVGR
ncbi:hypothetical protein [Bosea sp. 2RAB26]|uniref:hypothetical protein n=1 Tax=Bosea sp. 2RAB26 TaxID=3237476 RepID=UPI003F91E46B